MFRVWCKFETETINPLTGKRGAWKVTYCHPIFFGSTVKKLWQGIFLGNELGILTDKQFKKGNFINPRKSIILNRIEV